VFALEALECLAEAAQAEAPLPASAAGAALAGEAKEDAAEAAAGALARLLAAGLAAEGGGAVEAAEGSGLGDEERGAREARARDVGAVFRAIVPAPPRGLDAGGAHLPPPLPPWARADLAPYSSAAEGGVGFAGASEGAGGPSWRGLATRAGLLLRELAATLLGAPLPCAPLPAAEAWAPSVTAALLRRTAAVLGELGVGNSSSSSSSCSSGSSGELAARLHFSPRQACGGGASATVVGAGGGGGGGASDEEPTFVVTASLCREPTLRLRLHFHGVPSLHSDDAPVIAGGPLGRAGAGKAGGARDGAGATGGGSTQWAALTDISAAREVAVYDFALREGASAVVGGAEGVLRTTTVYCLPSFRGALGRMRSVRANLRDALLEGIVSRTAVLVVLLLAAGPLCVPLLGAVWLCTRRGRSKAALTAKEGKKLE
jgi:hypothetical protein